LRQLAREYFECKIDRNSYLQQRKALIEDLESSGSLLLGAVPVAPTPPSEAGALNPSASPGATAPSAMQPSSGRSSDRVTPPLENASADPAGSATPGAAMTSEAVLGSAQPDGGDLAAALASASEVRGAGEGTSPIVTDEKDQPIPRTIGKLAGDDSTGHVPTIPGDRAANGKKTAKGLLSDSAKGYGPIVFAAFIVAAIALTVLVLISL
jgi:hypothetical protein